ncbi:hypothetical protein [Bacillus infantis]|uniref:Uncharacterized protein n=1 Tax=Bacillus infantis TaxID=324767 RepID=A0A5D4RGY2_9BACI|nr:hypothetical protein [Bacillus infantis]TYS50120.1 hypothetical protein FZD51_06085 [Bacillus infantis]
MIRQSVFYEEFEANTYPYWYGIAFDESDVDWEKEIFYFDVNAPFERLQKEDLEDSFMSISVGSAEIVKSQHHRNRLGIVLKKLKKRAEDYDADFRKIRQFIILVSDIEEILSFHKSINNM